MLAIVGKALRKALTCAGVYADRGAIVYEGAAVLG